MGDMMAKRRAFLDIIKEKGALVLDGGLGSELERYGCNLQHKLWSAKILMDQPDIIKKIHISYLAAGADIIQSSGYQATVAGFKGLGYGTEEAIELVKLSVRLAVQARNEFLEAKATGALTLRGITLGEETPDGVRYFSEGALPKPLVAASVGPYGAFLADGSEYRGYPDVQTEYLEVFHIPRLAYSVKKTRIYYPLKLSRLMTKPLPLLAPCLTHTHREEFQDGLPFLVKMDIMFLVVKPSLNARR